MRKFKPLPPQGVLNELLRFDEDTGLLYHKERPREMFSREKDWKTWNTAWAGKVAGTKTLGYIQINTCGSLYRAHRVIWVMVYGEIPEDAEIDHINGIRDDNRLVNLRLASKSVNMHNLLGISTNTSGYKNIEWVEKHKGWVVGIGDNGVSYHFGYYSDLEEAKRVARYARAALCGRYANHGDGTHEECYESKEDFIRRIKEELQVKPQRNNTSGVRGVNRNKGRWEACAQKDRKRYRFGLHDTIEEAEEALKAGRIELGIKR
jgi:hypothetical protein